MSAAASGAGRTVRVVRFHEFGGPGVLRVEDLPVGEPGPGELRVRIRAIGLNRAEAAFRAGNYIEKAQLPARIGYEAAGVVEALGEGVTGFAPGEAVCVIPSFSMNRYGVYAEAAIVPAGAVVERPPGLSDAEAAAIWMPYLTAYGALVDICDVQKGEAVVITAASSSVGLAAIQIANRVGAIPIAVTRSAEKRAGLLAEGAAHVIVSGDTELAAEVMRVTDGRGARVVFDPVGGPGVEALAAALAPQGVLVLYGNLAGVASRTPFPFGLALARGLSLRGYLVFELIHDPQRFARADAFIRAGLAAGTLRPRIAEVFPFDRIVEAHTYLESNQQLGKVVVTVPH